MCQDQKKKGFLSKIFEKLNKMECKKEDQACCCSQNKEDTNKDSGEQCC